MNTPLVTVDEGAILAGAGVINGIVDNHGDFAPGNSISNPTINGSMTNGGNYQVQVDAAGNSAHLDTITGGREALANAADDLAAKIIAALTKEPLNNK